MAMVMIWKAVDVAWALYSLIFAVAAPLVNSQLILPRRLFPAPLVRVRQCLEAKLDHYLLADPPPFFRGLIWFTFAFFWPVCVANLYGTLTRRRRWVATTALMGGVCILTYLSAMYGEMLGSGRATPKLIGFYVPYIFLAVAMVFRGVCCTCSELLPADTAAAGQVEASSAQKKRA